MSKFVFNVFYWVLLEVEIFQQSEGTDKEHSEKSLYYDIRKKTNQPLSYE